MKISLQGTEMFRYGRKVAAIFILVTHFFFNDNMNVSSDTAAALDKYISFCYNCAHKTLVESREERRVASIRFFRFLRLRCIICIV